MSRRQVVAHHTSHGKYTGPRVAAILSIVETCRRLKILAREYLAAVLPGLANLSIQRLPELTPTAWAAREPLKNSAVHSLSG